MLVIGEKINATRKAIASALENRDADHIVKTAKEQDAAGATYIDINGGNPREGAEEANMVWLMDLVQAGSELPIAVDTANPDVMRKGLSMAKKKPILNSISLESERLENMLDIVKEFDCMVVALLMSDDGTPCSMEDRVQRAEQLIARITDTGKKLDEIIVDPCFLPVSADAASGRHVIDAIAQIRSKWPEVHIGGGLSNVSFGLPKRKNVNLAALAQCIYAGMDAAITDPCVDGVMATIYAAEAVAGRDEFCMNYVTAMR